MNNLAPLALFVFNRAKTTKKVLNSLAKNKLIQKTNIYIFCDAPKFSKDNKEINKVRKLIDNFKNCKKKSVIIRDVNFGLKKNILEGLKFIFKKYEKVIVLEDDILTSKYFLTYMNEGLKKFKDIKKVASIHSYCYPIEEKDNLEDHFFLRGADCWGWGTWKDRWSLYNDNSKKLFQGIKKKKLINDFNVYNSYFFSKMLLNNLKVNEEKKSWAINWYASMYLKNKLTLYPKNSLCKNIGFNVDGTHSLKKNFYPNMNSKFKRYNSIDINIPLKENLFAKKKISKFLKKLKTFERLNYIFNKFRFR